MLNTGNIAFWKFSFKNLFIRGSDESVWDFKFGIGIFRPKYRGIGIGFGIEISMKSVSESVLHWCRYEILRNSLPAAVNITLQSNLKSAGSRYLPI